MLREMTNPPGRVLYSNLARQSRHLVRTHRAHAGRNVQLHRALMKSLVHIRPLHDEMRQARH